MRQIGLPCNDFHASYIASHSTCPCVCVACNLRKPPCLPPSCTATCLHTISACTCCLRACKVACTPFMPPMPLCTHTVPLRVQYCIHTVLPGTQYCTLRCMPPCTPYRGLGNVACTPSCPACNSACNMARYVACPHAHLTGGRVMSHAHPPALACNMAFYVTCPHAHLHWL